MTGLRSILTRELNDTHVNAHSHRAWSLSVRIPLREVAGSRAHTRVHVYTFHSLEGFISIQHCFAGTVTHFASHSSQVFSGIYLTGYFTLSKKCSTSLRGRDRFNGRKCQTCDYSPRVFRVFFDRCCCLFFSPKPCFHYTTPDFGVIAVLSFPRTIGDKKIVLNAVPFSAML